MVFDEPAGDDSPDVYIKSNVTGTYEIVSEVPKSHDEITPEGDFPTMGDRFLPVFEVRRDGSKRDEVSFISFYTDVQRQLAKIEASEGDRVRIRVSSPGADGEWEATVEYLNL
jgi:hypothetical protein